VTKNFRLVRTKSKFHPKTWKGKIHSCPWRWPWQSRV